MTATENIAIFKDHKIYINCVNAKKDFGTCNDTQGGLEFPPDCESLSNVSSKAKDRKELCTNSAVPGTFSSCVQYIKNNMSDIMAEIGGGTCPSTTIMTTTILEATTLTTTMKTTAEPTTVVATTATTTTQPSLPPPKDEITILRPENGEIVKEKTSYNPETKELSISVYAHSTRDAVTIVIGEIMTVIVFDNDAFVLNTTKHFLDILNGAENGQGSKSEEAIEIVKSETELKERFSLNRDLGDLTISELTELSEYMQALIASKRVKKVEPIDVDKDQYRQTNNTTLIDINLLSKCPPPPPPPACPSAKVMR